MKEVYLRDMEFNEDNLIPVREISDKVYQKTLNRARIFYRNALDMIDGNPEAYETVMKVMDEKSASLLFKGSILKSELDNAKNMYKGSRDNRTNEEIALNFTLHSLTEKMTIIEADILGLYNIHDFYGATKNQGDPVNGKPDFFCKEDDLTGYGLDFTLKDASKFVLEAQATTDDKWKEINIKGEHIPIKEGDSRHIFVKKYKLNNLKKWNKDNNIYLFQKITTEKENLYAAIPLNTKFVNSALKMDKNSDKSLLITDKEFVFRNLEDTLDHIAVMEKERLNIKSIYKGIDMDEIKSNIKNIIKKLPTRQPLDEVVVGAKEKKQAQIPSTNKNKGHDLAPQI